MTLASALTRLQGVRTGMGYFTARCPAHDDRNASLSIREGEGGKAFLKCFAGCDYRRIIAALDGRSLKNVLGLHDKLAMLATVPDDAGRIEIARCIWRDARPATGTTVERYLRLRGITSLLPPSIRFAIGRHAPSQTGPWAVMLAAVQNLAGEIVGVHRTFLTGDGRKAPVEPVKMALGPLRGCAVRLAKAAATLALAEGIETALSVRQATGVATWATLGTSNLASVELPACVREVIIFADGDDPGERAALVAAERFTREYRKVRIARPAIGTDFNDYLYEMKNATSALANIA